MRRKISFSILIAVMIFFALNSSAFAAGNTVRVSTAKELENALNKGDSVTDIIITKSITGNFTVPRWIHSIKGDNANITITPVKESEAVFYVEAVGLAKVVPFTSSTAKSMTFESLTIICGKGSGINCPYLEKQLIISNVTFSGIRKGEKLTGINPSVKTNFSNCNFRDLMWAIWAGRDVDYDININRCNFKSVSQALGIHGNKGGKVFINNCTGENLGYWVAQHKNGEDITYVNVGQNTINSCKDSDFLHKIVPAMKDSEISTSPQMNNYLEDLSRAFMRLPVNARNNIIFQREKFSGWDNIRVYATTKFNEKLRDIDLSSAKHYDIDECIALYALLACAPVSDLLNSDGNINYNQLYNFCGEILENCVHEKNLIYPIIYSFLDPTELSPLGRVGARLTWGDSGNVREVFASPREVEQTPDRIFRENIHRLQDWLTALDDARKKMQTVKNELQSAKPDDYKYIHEFEQQLRAIYDFGVASNRVTAAICFDLPVDVAFVSNFARVTSEKNSSKIIGICRELGSFYALSQRLCVLNRTNNLRNEIHKTWKDALVETHFLRAADNSKYENLVSSLATDPDIMRDAQRLNDFFRDWR